MTVRKTESLWTRREMLARVALGSAAGLALTACGGGGGGSSDDAQSLRDAFAKLQNGMIWTDVEALVGFPANDVRNFAWVRWVIDDVILSVQFRSGDENPISSATLKDGSAVSQSKNFD